MRHDSMYVMLIPVMLFLYQLLIGKRCPPHAGWRKVSEYVYLFHPGVIVLVRGVAKQMGVTAILVENRMVFYLAVCGGSSAAGGGDSAWQKRYGKGRTDEDIVLQRRTRVRAIMQSKSSSTISAIGKPHFAIYFALIRAKSLTN